MTSHGATDERSCAELQAELDLFRENMRKTILFRYLRLKPRRKDSSDSNSSDPFEFLPSVVGDLILSCLTPKELLDSTQVSKTWKNFIESRESRMRKAMDKIVLKFNARTAQEMNPINLLSGREYKHVEANLMFPIGNYASSLESLKVTQGWNHEPEPDPTVFPKLEQLILDYSQITNFIRHSSFPEVTHLRCGLSVEDSIPIFTDFISKFPKLKVLMSLPNSQVDWETVTFKSSNDYPKLEVVHIDSLNTSFCNTFKDTLTEIHLLMISSSDFIDLLRICNNLETLSIFVICDDDTDENFQFPRHLARHEKLQTLKVYNSALSNEVFPRILASFPSLQFLMLLLNFRYDEKGFIRFMVDNVANLKSLTCHSLSNETMKFYNDMKENENQLGNTNFEIVFFEPKYADNKWDEDMGSFFNSNFK